MSEKTDSRAFISIEDWLDENKKANLNIAVGLLSFSTMLFHFAAVYFFTFKLGSIALVGIFLWLWNFFAFLFDVPIWILQYHVKAKILLWAGAIAQIVAMLIFAYFIFWAEDFVRNIASGAGEVSDLLAETSKFVFGSVLDWLLLLVAALCYWFNREINDITFLSYILSKANPSQYKTIIAQKNLFFGVGSFLWLMSSGIILTFSPKWIIVYILVIFIALTFISLKFFDSKKKIIKLSDIKRFKVYFDKNGLNKAKNDISDEFVERKDQVVQSVKSIDLKETLWATKYIFMKPLTLKSKMISVSELITKTKESIIDIVKTLIYAKSKSLIVYWSFSMVLTFGFWDTFASTFLLDFLDSVKSGWSFALLGIIAIPAFVLQEPFWKLADKVWVYKIANIGLAISGASLVTMSFFSSGEINMWIVMGLAIMNSVWYAICMSLSVAVFLESYNKVYAEKNGLTEIDANASAAPMKILQNLANVVGLVLGWIILDLLKYSGFFAVFGILILVFLWWSIMRGKEVRG